MIKTLAVSSNGFFILKFLFDMKNLIVLFFILNFSTSAQQITILGRVDDAVTNSPLVKANIRLSTQFGIGTYSDDKGEFILTAVMDSTDTLIVSFVGYEDFEMTLIFPEENNRTIEIQLEEGLINSY